MIKAAFFDIDGTLVEFGTKNMPKSTKKALEILRDKGVKLFVATGRTPIDTAFIKDFFEFDGYISSNGQYCILDDELLYEHTIEESDLKSLAHKAYKQGVPAFFATKNGTRCNILDARALNIHETAGISIPVVCDTIDEAISGGVYQIMLIISRENENEFLKDAKNVIGTRWGGEFVDVIPYGGGKHIGLEYVLKKLNISANEAIAFGDGENDSTMLKYAGVGVAMGTAPEDVMAVADHVTTSAGEDGIYKFLSDNGYI